MTGYGFAEQYNRVRSHTRQPGLASTPAGLERPARVDPPGCGCTDCITGYSVPLDSAGMETVRALVAGEVANATSTPLTVETKVVAEWAPASSDYETHMEWVVEVREVRP